MNDISIEEKALSLPPSVKSPFFLWIGHFRQPPLLQYRSSINSLLPQKSPFSEACKADVDFLEILHKWKEKKEMAIGYYWKKESDAYL